MILSDASIRKELAAGRVVIDPLNEADIQPSSVDLHVDRFFRVFRNDTTPFIDPKLNQENLTELVEVQDGDSFILHPGEFVLGSTLERVALPEDMVARLEGKSSLGRLGLLIHSSLPGSERILVLENDRLQLRAIEEVVRKNLRGFVVGFDPETFEVNFHAITGWYEGPPDRIYEIVLASGRHVRVTAGHNVFTLDRDGELAKVRTGELKSGVKIAVPRRIPDPLISDARIDLLELIPESAYPKLVCQGPAIKTAFASNREEVVRALHDSGYKHVDYYEKFGKLPMGVARQIVGLLSQLGSEDSVSFRGARSAGLSMFIDVDLDVAWLLGMYIAEGYKRDGQFTISNTNRRTLDRVESVLRKLGLPIYRPAGAITCCSSIGSLLLDWLGTGEKAPTKRVPPVVFGWPEHLVQAFVSGLIEGDGSRESNRVNIWTTSEGLVGDLLILYSRLGYRVGTSWKSRPGTLPICQIYTPPREHKLLTSVPLPDRLLVDLREDANLDQVTASQTAGYKNASDLNNLERRSGRAAVRFSTLRRLRAAYAAASDSPKFALLDRLVSGDLLWDEVVDVRDTGSVEPIFDIEVRPRGRRIENFLAGHGGVFVSNTAGFVDAGWDGHLTLELSNVANLPIAIYPGMKIGQISFLQMTSPADAVYGSESAGSKYQGQSGPTPSRYYMNFKDEDATGSNR